MINVKDLESPTTGFEGYKAILFPFAYNITGDFMAAEDIVQEVLTKHLLVSDPAIENPKHYLIRAVINRSINEKKMLRTRMEDYRGKWLPSPVVTEENIYRSADREKILHYSLLVLLERLNAKERAVFILKETFDFEHEEIADILEIKPDHSRQLLKRAKEKISPLAKKRVQTKSSDGQFLQDLVEAISTSDVARTKLLLSNDVQCVSDGGKVKAARNMLTGKDRVSKFLKAIYGKYYPEGAAWKIVEINFHPAILFTLNNKVFRCIVFELKGEVVQKIFIIVNPDKLQQLKF
jgi:RNA polymerase sigma-70 factor (ECF subfamily)